MDIVIADADKTPLYIIADYQLDCAFGSDENSIEITCDPEYAPVNKGYVYVDGTEYGGTIDEITASTVTTAGGGREITATGRSWHGILAGKVLVPDSGSAYITVSGSISDVLQTMIERMGLEDIFSAPSSESDPITVSSYSFTRFTDGYTGLKAMCKAYGAKLTIRSSDNTVLLGARAVVDYGSTVDSDLIDFDITKIARRTNHLVCGGEGEGVNRTIIHFYADEDGNVSQTQSLFGIDEITYFYDYNNIGDDELAEQGEEKLIDLQGEGTVEVEVHDDLDIDIGDIVASRDNSSGLFVSAEVTKKIVSAQNGVASFSYEIGTSSTGTSGSVISGSGESTGGGHAYYAGKGLTLDNYTFNADVDQSDLDTVANTANTALSTATTARSEAGQAQATADAAVASISANDPISATRSGSVVTISHNDSGVNAGSYGATANATPGFGESATMGAQLSIDSEGHITSATGRTITIPDTTATTDASGLMSASDKAKLDTIESGAQANTVTGVKGDAESSYRTGDINLTPANIGAATTSHTHAISDVTNLQSELDDKAALTHSHAASDITSGTLPIARGGTGNTSGNAATATKLETERTITLIGAVSGSASFDGSANITITTTGDSEAAGFLAAHPVGAIFETTVSDNPGSLYGGTWVAMPSVGAYKWKRTA